MRYSSLLWHPHQPAAMRSLKSLSSSIRLQTDFGAAEPAQRPQKTLSPLYITEPVSRKGAFMRYIRSAREELPYIAAAVFGVGLYSAATLAIPSGFGQLIDFASKGEMPLGTSMQLLGWFCVAGVGNFVRLACIGYAGERVIARLRERLYRGILSQPTAFFDAPENRTGALVQRLSMDCNVVGSSLTEAVMQGSKNLLMTVGSIGIMLYYSPTLTGVIVSMIPPLAIFAGKYGRYVRRLQQEMQDALAVKATVAEERLGNIRTVKAFGRNTEELKWYQKKVDIVFQISKKMLFYNASYSSSLQFLGYGALYGIMWAGSLLVSTNSLSPGIFFSVVMYTVYCGIGLMGLTNIVTEINKGYGASLRLYDILDKEEALGRSQGESNMVIPSQCQWNIKLDNVSFSYPTRPEALVYNKLNLEIKASRCTCVVGSSGSGKSSLALLLLKLYDVTEGTMSIDGNEIGGLDTQWLRGKVGYVGQEPVLFGGTIAQNIAYGASNHNWDDPMDRWLYSAVVDAAMRANAHDFISSLPEGYDTYVGENGRSLSGGQKQRIAIARALLRAPQVLILDEATSALDSESEVVVLDAISRLIEETKKDKKHRTVLMFAHKLSMIRKADHVVVLDKGRVAVQGTYDDVCLDPLFCQIVGLSKSTVLETETSEN